MQFRSGRATVKVRPDTRSQLQPGRGNPGKGTPRLTRTRDHDGCPGALTLHHAADGPLARVRLPGGMISADQLDALAGLAEQFAAATLELTARGNIQLRGITDPDAVASALGAAGLLPSASHELVRNILASPLSGRRGGHADVRPLVAALDAAIQADPALADLPGRFLYCLDDGTGDVVGLRADAGVQMLDDGTAALLLAGRDTGVRIPPDEVLDALLGVARRFLTVRGDAWRVSELDDPDILLEGLARREASLSPPLIHRAPVGWIAQDDERVALAAAVPLGVLTARQAQFVAAVGAPVVITPWRSLLVCDLDEGVADTALRVLAPLGLVFDDSSHWLHVSACVGSPGCDRSRAEVRADAARAVESGTHTEAVHYVGCERACGRPVDAQVFVATGDGYRPAAP